MKIWILNQKTSSYQNIRLNCEEHSSYEYVGNFDDNELKTYLLNLKKDIDVDKNIKLLKYYGYLHLFSVIS